MDSSGWGQPESSSTRRPAATPQNVRDDWEDEEDESELIPIEEKNKKLWEEANNKESAPMPSFIVSSSFARSVASPPPAAFQPALKILKRPVNSQAASPSPPPAQPVESLEDREARYQAARNRIFGDSSTTEGSLVHVAQRKETLVIRNPHGPDETASSDTTPSKGFGTRSKPPPDAS